MNALPIRLNVKTVEHPGAPDAFFQRWKIDGECRRAETEVTVTVINYGATTPTMQACIGHELGHAAYSSVMTMDEFRTKHADTFQWEVLAWIKWVERNRRALPISYDQATFILDALNTYRRGHNVPENEWSKARALVESWTADPQGAIKTYEPLEPPDDAEPPKGCGEGFGFLPNISSDDDTESEDAEDDDQGGDDQGDEPNTESEGDGIDRTERDAWLHSGEGMQATAEGMGTLESKMLFHGWDMENLPAITRALLGQ